MNWFFISASHEGRGILLDVVRRVSEEIFMPFTVGGGIRTLEEATRLIQAGAEKVSINSAAVRTPQLITQISRKFGRNATVVNIDPRRVRHNGHEVWEVHIQGGRVPTGLEAVDWARRVEELGAGEIVLNVMNADGTTSGYDLEMTAAVSDAVKIPVVASGGAGSPQHMLDVLTTGHADAALAASIFHFGTYTVGQVKQFLHEHHVPVRLV